MSDTAAGALPPQTHTASVKDRTAHGQALREKVKRGDHAEWTAPKHRRDPIEILIEQGESRLPNLLPLRYSRMAVSPFAFLRGSAAVMAEDLAATPATGLTAQSGGDCHCLNFGGFATPERHLVFDINDFDETAVAPWEWDLKRLATSFVVATLDIMDKDARVGLAETVARRYRETMAEIAGMPVLDAWYRGLVCEDADKAADIGVGAKAIRKAVTFLTHAPIVSLKHGGGPKPRIEDAPPLVYHPSDNEAEVFCSAVMATLPEYVSSLTPERQTLVQRYRMADAAYKVVGVGSVGTLCGVLLMISGNGEALFLQFKEATRSVLEAHAGTNPYAHHGERVVRGQRLLQAASDILLGFATGPAGRHVYVRQLRDAKIKPQLETMSAKHFQRYAETCGEVLARAHARSADAVVLAAYLGKNTTFDEAIGGFAHAYGKQTVADHAALKKAIADGRLPAAYQGS
jgi:uncharacterized protein (DUF2252 family)